jgi:DNA ligase (NAD+)
MFTGKMELGNRDDMQKKARELGATVLSSVSKKLEILIIGAKPSGSKLTKAKKYECEILSEEDYLALIKEN